MRAGDDKVRKDTVERVLANPEVQRELAEFHDFVARAVTVLPDYERGVRDGMIRAALIVRRHEGRGDLSLLACDIEDTARMRTDPETCEHPYWDARPGGLSVCRSCGTDTTDMEAMGG